MPRNPFKGKVIPGKVLSSSYDREVRPPCKQRGCVRGQLTHIKRIDGIHQKVTETCPKCKGMGFRK